MLVSNSAMSDPVIVDSEVAYLLRQELGPIYDWKYVLADIRRFRHDQFSLPTAFRANRQWYYRLADVRAFIDDVREQIPESGRGIPVQVEEEKFAGNGATKSRVRPRIGAVKKLH